MRMHFNRHSQRITNCDWIPSETAGFASMFVQLTHCRWSSAVFAIESSNRRFSRSSRDSKQSLRPASVFRYKFTMYMIWAMRISVWVTLIVANDYAVIKSRSCKSYSHANEKNIFIYAKASHPNWWSHSRSLERLLSFYSMYSRSIESHFASKDKIL